MTVGVGQVSPPGGGFLRRLLFSASFYPALLKGKVPDRLACTPRDLWDGDPRRADELFRGTYRFRGSELSAPNQPPWLLADRPIGWREELHGFAWLRHFEAQGGDAAKRHARALAGSWITYCGRYTPFPWRPDILGRRLVSWFTHAGLLLDGADDAFKGAFLASLAEQTRHLGRSAALAAPGRPRLLARIALVYGALCLPGPGRKLDRALSALEREVAAQVLGDGGHVSRCPSQHHGALDDLIGLRAALIEAGRDLPQWLQNAIDRMTPMLRFFRHGDGGLALFNGGWEEGTGGVDLTLALADSSGRPLSSAPHVGFERVGAGRSLLIMDAGQPAPPGSGALPYAGCLSFEFSHWRERLIVNCGAPNRQDGPWAEAMRATAAHSTLCVDDTNSFDLERGGQATGGKARGGKARRPREVTLSRDEADGNCWIEASHDGYDGNFGLIHRRRLFLAEGGEDLRGEDCLLAQRKWGGPQKNRQAKAVPFAVRFHLHPSLRASLLRERGAVLLRTPSRQGWRFRCAGGEISLEESVYLGRRGEVRRSEQIVIRGLAGGKETIVKWALSRLPQDNPKPERRRNRKDQADDGDGPVQPMLTG